MVGIKSNNLHYGIVILFLSLLYFAAIAGRHQIFTRGEGREAIVVQSMLSSADYILPLRNGNEIPSKPPLFHWIASAVASLDGNLSAFDVRAPSVISAATALFFSVLFYSKILGYPIGAILLTLLVSLSSFESLRGAAHGRVDALFATTVTFACFSLFALIENRKRSFSILLLSAFTLLFAGLAKGPAGVLIPGFICAAYLALDYWNSRNRHEFISSSLLLFIAGSAAMLGLAVWYYLAYRERGAEFLQVQLYDENLARLFNLPTSGAYSESLGHEKPFYFSFIYLIVGFLPWSLLLPTYIVSLYRRIKERKLFENRFYLFALIWVATFLLAVTISSSKRTVYFLPCYPALAYLLIFEVWEATRLQRPLFFTRQLASGIKWFAIILAALLGIILMLLLSVGFIKPLLGVMKIDPSIQTAIIDWRFLLATATALALPATLLIARSGKAFVHSQWPKGIALLAIGVLLINLVVAQFVSPFLSAVFSPKFFLEQIASEIENQPIYQYQDNFYAAIFYSKRTLPMIKDLSELQGRSGYLLASAKSLNDFVGEEYSVVAVSDQLAANQKAKLALIKFGKLRQ